MQTAVHGQQSERKLITYDDGTNVFRVRTKLIMTSNAECDSAYFVFTCCTFVCMSLAVVTSVATDFVNYGERSF